MYWTGNHYVIVYDIQENQVMVSDPAIGKLSYSIEEFCMNWNNTLEQKITRRGYTLLLEDLSLN